MTGPLTTEEHAVPPGTQIEALLADGRLEEARTHAEAWLAREPEALLGWQLLGNLRLFLSEPEGAEAAYRRALELDPLLARNRANLAMALLAQGRYREAWPLYEARFDPTLAAHDRVGFAGLPDATRWQGEALAGRRILLVREQGFGDQIQFMRLASRLRARGAANILLLAAPPLCGLDYGPCGIDAVTPTLPPPGDHDCWSPLLSLPLYLDLDAPAPPPALPYLRAPADCRALWRRQIDAWAGGNASFGLVWAGSPGNAVDGRRSLPLDAVLRLLEARGRAVPFSLQLGAPGMERLAEQCARGLVPLLDMLRDFTDTAAAIERLDLVITVDTAVAHLAGALGRPVWLLLPKGADWRWGQQGETTPWYPGARLFRQRTAGDWDEVMARVATALKEWAAGT